MKTANAARNEPITIKFTGEESDRFVRFAEKLVQHGAVPYVKVNGQEPLTRTEIVIEGKVESTVFDRYIRYLTVIDRDGQSFNVGGSNATQSIASSSVEFTRVPAELGGVRISSDDIIGTLELLMQGKTNRVHLLSQVKTNLTSLSLVRLRDVSDVLVKYAIEDHKPEVRREAVDTLADCAHLESISLVNHLLGLLRDSSPLVRRDVALRLRGLERDIRDSGNELLERTISALIESLKDPDAYVRTYAAEDLGYIWVSTLARRVVEPLVACLQDDSDDHVRWAAAIALGRINDPSVISPLLDAVQNDLFFRVRQSSLLGLGRRAKEAIQYYQELPKVLLRILESDDYSVRGYAAFAIGQLGESGKESIPVLIDALVPRTDSTEEAMYAEHIRSNAALALEALTDFVQEHGRQTLESNLVKALSIRSDFTDKSPYFTWFLLYGAELLASLELHESTHAYYSALSERYIDWRRMYYRAASLYEYSEQKTIDGDPGNAYATLLDARQALIDCRNYPKEAEAGVAFQKAMISARIMMHEAITEWEDVVGGEYERCRQKFEAARRIYSSFRAREGAIQVVTPGRSLSKRLTQREQDFIFGLRSIAHIGVTMIDIETAIRRDNNMSKGVTLLVTCLDDIEELHERLEKSQTVYLISLVRQLSELFHAASEELTQAQYAGRDSESVRVILRVVRQARELLKRSAIPRPASACPIVGLGKAELEFRVAGTAAGSGDQHEPYLFPCNSDLIIEADVRVVERIRADDELVFVFKDKDRTIEERVPVFEQGWQIPIQLGIDAPAYAAFPYDALLEFRSRDCSQVVYQKRIWIQRYDPASGFLFPTLRERDLPSETLQSVWVASAQILSIEKNVDSRNYLERMYMKEYLEQGVLLFRREVYQDIYRSFERTLRTIKDDQPKTSLVVFPELSAPWTMREQIMAWASEHDFYIVVGFEHRQDPSTYYWQNVVQLINPHKETWSQVKNLPARITIAGERISENIQEGNPRIINTVQTKLGKIILLVCSEAVAGTTFELGIALKRQVKADLIAIPSMTPVVQDFYGWAEVYLRKLYCGVVFANHAQFGFSTVFSPKKAELKTLEEARTALAQNTLGDIVGSQAFSGNESRIVAPGMEGFVVQEIEVQKLRNIREGAFSDPAYISSPD